MVDLFDELKEDLKQQRLERLWHKSKFFLIGGAIAIIAFTAYNSWQKHSNKTHKEETSLKYAKATAIRLHDDERLKILNDIVKTGSEGYAILARFKIAALTAKKKQYQKAVNFYDEIAESIEIPKYYQNLAASKAFFLLTEYQKDDSSIESRYKNISLESNVWNFTVKTAMAMLLLEKNDLERAKNILKLLSENVNTPQMTKDRAKRLLDSLS